MENQTETQIQFTPKFFIGEIVYLVTDPMQDEYIVCALRVEDKCIRYFISHAYHEEIQVSAFELSNIKTVK